MKIRAMVSMLLFGFLYGCSRPDGYCANSCRGESNQQACYDECMKSGDGGVEDLDEEDPAVDLEDEGPDPEDLVSRTRDRSESEGLDEPLPQRARLMIPVGR